MKNLCFIDHQDLCLKKVQKCLENPPSYVSIDTEFVRKNTYYPKVGLIQIGFEDVVWIIDATICDIHCLKEIFFHPKIIKVFHSCRQDLEIFQNYYNDIPFPLFDLQIASTLVGLDSQISLGKLSEMFLGVALNKSTQHSDWLCRPLTQTMLDYAYEDARVIYDLYDLIYKMLCKSDLVKWHDGAIFSLVNALKQPAIESIMNSLQRQVGKLEPAMIQKMATLMLWREDKAKEYDKPKTHLLSAKLLEELIEEKLLSKSAFKELLFKNKAENYFICKNSLREDLFLFLQSLDGEYLIPYFNRIFILDKKMQKSLKSFIIEKANTFNIPASFLLDKNEIKNYCINPDFKKELPIYKQEIIKEFEDLCLL